MDIEDLRKNSRNLKFCRNINVTQFDKIIKELLENDKLTSSEKVKLLASISNILLINQELYDCHFHKNFKKQFLSFLLEFTESYKSSHEIGKDATSFLAIYRSFFLALYGVQDNNYEEMYERISFFLINEFHRISQNYDLKQTEGILLNVIIELLKALYALFHNYSISLENDLHLRYIKLINNLLKGGIIDIQVDQIQIVNNLLNLLLAFDYELDFKNEINIDEYSKFHNILVQLLQKSLDKTDLNEYFQTTKILSVIVKQVSKLNKQYKSPHYIALKEFFFVIAIPNKNDGVYKSLMEILIANNNSNSEISCNTKSSVYLNNLILDLFFQTSWSEEYRIQLVGYLEKCGYILGKCYLDSNKINIPGDLDISQYLEPKYFGERIKKNCFENVIENLKKDIDTTTKLEDLSQEEKEMEAEKLFVLFDRMEKTGVFQNFKNPVREWQQSGKFEELE